ncbi:hypothetical protein [Microbacterium hominis]|uniref:hypothetical protein n=1 Tax=Microbacterium hominis TaxID=162426 RepID=UPI0021E06C15|nr:hypothetical protein [Microbacterium hominis]
MTITCSGVVGVPSSLSSRAMRSRTSGRPAGSESAAVAATRAASKPRTISIVRGGDARHRAQEVDGGGRGLEEALALRAPGRQRDRRPRDARAAALPPFQHAAVGERGVGRHDRAA